MPENSFITLGSHISIHGLAAIFTVPSRVFKLFWLLVLLGSTYAFLYNVIRSIQQFQTNPTVVNYHLRDEPVPFPAITICNLNPYKKLALMKYRKMATAALAMEQMKLKLAANNGDLGQLEDELSRKNESRSSRRKRTTDIPLINLECWKDGLPSPRAIPGVENYGYFSDWYKHRTNAIQKCAAICKQLGYQVFAVQDGGWCATAADAESTYQKYGPSTGCASDGEGGSGANEVYKIPECVPIPIWKGTNQYNASYAVVGSTALITCEEGFYLSGEAILTCNSSYQWNASLPKCEASTSTTVLTTSFASTSITSTALVTQPTTSSPLTTISTVFTSSVATTIGWSTSTPTTTGTTTTFTTSKSKASTATIVTTPITVSLSTAETPQPDIGECQKQPCDPGEYCTEHVDGRTCIPEAEVNAAKEEIIRYLMTNAFVPPGFGNESTEHLAYGEFGDSSGPRSGFADIDPTAAPITTGVLNAIQTEMMIYFVQQLSDFQKAELGYTSPEMITQCAFGDDKQCAWDSRLDTTLGNCYCFNNNISYRRMTDRPGSNNGLKFEADVSLKTYLDSQEPVGLKMAIHVPGETAFPAFQGVGILPGYDNYFSIKMTRIKAVKPPQGKCVADDSEENQNFKYSGNYTVMGCELLEKQRRIAKSCNCYSPYYEMPNDDIFKPCDFNKVHCVRRVEEVMEEKQACQETCEQEVISVTSTISKLMELADHQKPTTRIVRQLARVSVYYPTLGYLTLKEEPMYGIIGLLSDFGGQMGLFLGCSVISLVELVILLCAAVGEARKLVM